VIDIHSHILFGIDDGARNIDESIRMIHAAAKEGIKVIIATPHFHEHILRPEKTYENFRTLSEKTKDLGVDLKLGFEIALNPLLTDAVFLINDHSLNETEYILVEYPYFTFNQRSCKLLDSFQKNRFKPIIAHPERNGWGLRNRRIINEIKESGCLIQVSIGSIIGAYGKSARRAAKYIIKRKIADFVASDAHREGFYSWYGKAWQNVAKWVNEDYANKLFFENGKIILEK
jgi:protein-tyrosine phosphatase